MKQGAAIRLGGAAVESPNTYPLTGSFRRFIRFIVS